MSSAKLQFDLAGLVKLLFLAVLAATLLLPGSLLAQNEVGQPYLIQHSDNLWKLAEKYLGDGNKFPLIIAATAAKAGLVQLSGDLGGTSASPTVVDLTITGQTLGDLIYFDGTNWIRRGIGSSGNVLTVTGGVPVWAAAP